MQGALKQCALVEFTECRDVRVAGELVYGLCTFRVSVASPSSVLTNAARYNTQTVLAAIMKTLTGALLADPFLPDVPVKLANISREVFDDGAVSSQAEFQIFTKLFTR